MIDSGMPAVPGSLGNLDLVGAPAGTAPRARPLVTLDGIGKLLLIIALVILLLPAMLLVSVVALLVPCLLRVPVCGPSLPPSRPSSGK